MIKIYLASRYSRRPEMEGYARQLQGLGFYVASDWVFGKRSILDNPGEAKKFVTADRMDVLRSDLIINFAEPKEVDYPRGSRHWEAGAAYERGKVCYIVGRFGTELECVFHNLEGIVIFENWEALYFHLEQLSLYEKAKDIMRRIRMEGVIENRSSGDFLANGDTIGRTISDPGHCFTGIADRDNQDLHDLHES